MARVEYRPRVIDAQLAASLDAVGAVIIERRPDGVLQVAVGTLGA